jgi:trk system potassium uptake protein TrkA
MHALIVGGGEVGAYLASLLLMGKHTVTVMEIRPEEMPRLRQLLDPDVVVVGDGTDPAVLETVGIRQAHVVAAVRCGVESG